MEAEFEYLDMTRMAINGWSYGGYLALRGIMDFPHVFKVMLPYFIISWVVEF